LNRFFACQNASQVEKEAHAPLEAEAKEDEEPKQVTK